MTTLLEKTLDDSRDTGEVVEIYRDRLTREPLVGLVLQRSQRVFAVERLDGLYQSNGIAAAYLTDVTRVKRLSRELKSTLVNSGRSEQLPDVAMLELTAAMTMLEERYGHVTLFVEKLDPGVCFIGEVRAIDDEYVVMQQYGTFATMDRSNLLLRTNEITRVEAGGTYERELLRRHRASALGA